MRDITFDAITNTITISRSFYDASKEFGSEEQKQLAQTLKKNILIWLLRSSLREQAAEKVNLKVLHMII